MLQQTRVEVVRDYFARWMLALPTLHSLSTADEEQVLGLWQGLGYYSRARRLREGASFVVRELGGSLPAEPEHLLRVPGIGPYSAGAISSIAFGRQTPLVDGNVIRVITRVFALDGDPARAPLKRSLWDICGKFVQGERPGDFNQALMDLGATVCTPRKPRCGECPWNHACEGRKTGRAELLPELRRQPKKEEVHLVCLLCSKDDRYLVEKTPAQARWWAGLWTLPTRPMAPADSPLLAARALLGELGLQAERLDAASPLRHTITRFRVLFHPVRVVEPRGPGGLGPWRRFASPAELSTLALPAPHRKLLLAQPSPGQLPARVQAETSNACDPPIK